MEKSEFVIAHVLPGKLNALVKNLMQQTGTSDPNEAVHLINSGECTVTKSARKWREENGVIYFSVTSDGTTGAEWIIRLEKNGFRLSDYAKSILRSSDFKPTNGVTEVAVLKGVLFEDNERLTKNIRKVAGERSLETPNAEIAYLIREQFTDEEIKAMGLTWIVTMHEPIKDSDGRPLLLSAYRSDEGRWLRAYYGDPDDGWNREVGFAFAVSQVGA